MRVFLGILVALAVGFGAGWVVFEQPWETTPSGPTSTDVENALLRAERRDGRDADRANCGVRQATGGREYDCQVLYGVDSGLAVPRNFRAKVSGNEITFPGR